MSYPVRPYLIQDLIALGSVNLLAGMSGAGKTRIKFQILEEIERHNTFMGFPCAQPVIPHYIAFDRSLAAIHDVLNSMKCSLKCPIESYLDKAAAFGLMAIPSLPRLTEGCNLLILDGLDCLVPKLIDSQAVGTLMFQCAKLATRGNLAIEGLLGTPKVKSGEGYTHPRERIIGSSFWARLCETIMLLSQDDESDENSRTFHICPRNTANFRINMAFEQGRLIQEVLTKPEGSDLKLYAQLPTSFSTGEAVLLGMDLGQSESTIKRSLRLLVSQRMLAIVQRGEYIKVELVPRDTKVC